MIRSGFKFEKKEYKGAIVVENEDGLHFPIFWEKDMDCELSGLGTEAISVIVDFLKAEKYDNDFEVGDSFRKEKSGIKEALIEIMDSGMSMSKNALLGLKLGEFISKISGDSLDDAFYPQRFLQASEISNWDIIDCEYLYLIKKVEEGFSFIVFYESGLLFHRIFTVDNLPSVLGLKSVFSIKNLIEILSLNRMAPYSYSIQLIDTVGRFKSIRKDLHMNFDESEKTNNPYLLSSNIKKLVADKSEFITSAEFVLKIDKSKLKEGKIEVLLNKFRDDGVGGLSLVDLEAKYIIDESAQSIFFEWAGGSVKNKVDTNIALVRTDVNDFEIADVNGILAELSYYGGDELISIIQIGTEIVDSLFLKGSLSKEDFYYYQGRINETEHPKRDEFVKSLSELWK